MAITSQRTTAATPRIGTYTRLSEDRDGTSSATDRQLADTDAAAERTGQVVQRFSDPEASAYRKGAKRPGFAAMLAAFDQGLIDTIIVWRADRLARAFREWSKVLLRVDDHGLRIIDCAGVDTATAGGRQMLGILAEQARSEAATMGIRQARAARERAEKGLPGGRRQRPFGHSEDQSQLVEDEALLVREAADAVLGGATFGSVHRAWLARGVRRSPEGIRKMLASPRMVGAREVDGRLIATGAIAPILGDDTYQLLRTALSMRRPGRPRAETLLSGLVSCGNRGVLLTSGSQRGEPRYACHQRYVGAARAGCGKVSARRDRVDELVGEAVLLMLEGETARREGGGDDRALARLAEIADQKGELARLWAAKQLGSEEWAVARDALLEEERHLSARLVRGLLSGDARSEWARRPIAWRAALVRSVVAEVFVDVAGRGAGPRFRPERVRVVWQEEEAVDAGE
jgi:DNA invertase Pin-like site-specific DNA recombinase